MPGFIDLADAKLHLRLDETEEDMEIQRLIDAAAAHIGSIYGVVAAQEVDFQIDHFAANVRVPYRPVDGETIIVRYLDALGAEQVFEDFRAYARDGWTWLQPKVGKAWPSIAPVEGAIAITATAGYSPANAPADLVHASRLLVDHWYNNRDGTDLPPAVDSLLNHYRFRRV